MARFGRRRFGSKRKRYVSQEALRHIEEARHFSSEVGGVDGDVKRFFFSLSAYELEALLKEYGQKYGEDTRQYAVEAYPHWKSGRRQMSGLVAKRLFDLLPNRMPLSTRYELVRKLWEHFCPKSHEVFYVGTGANMAQLQSRVSAHLEKVVQDYYISEILAEKFQWLSGGDVQVRQQLQNYFQQLKKAFLAEALRNRLDVLASHLNDCPEGHTFQTIKLGNHVIEIKCTHLADGVTDATTVNKIREQKRAAESKKEGLQSTFGCLFMVIIVVLLMKACAK